MQGRLTPPENGQIQSFPHNWEREFALAREAGLSAIEWIFEDKSFGSFDGLRHPIPENTMRRSVCADYFMRHRLWREQDGPIWMLHWLIGQCDSVGIGRIVLPFVDGSSLEFGGPYIPLDPKTRESRLEILLSRLIPICDIAQRLGVEIHLETDLSPSLFKDFLAYIPEVKVCYDIGNSACLGYDWMEEFDAYGSRIASVHVKDRKRFGGTVPLGEGDADLPGVIRALEKDLCFEGDYILQVARGESGKEMDWAKKNRELVERFIA